jgi:hypothetical protein
MEKLDYKIFRVKYLKQRVFFPDDLELVVKSNFFKKEFLLFNSNVELIHKSVYYRFNLLSLQLFLFTYGVIGNCWTHSNFRGKGIYGKMIDYILNDVKRSCILFVDKDNLSSINGIKRINGEEIYHYKIYRFFRFIAFFH